jgi:hypothetical protein
MAFEKEQENESRSYNVAFQFKYRSEIVRDCDTMVRVIVADDRAFWMVHDDMCKIFKYCSFEMNLGSDITSIMLADDKGGCASVVVCPIASYTREIHRLLDRSDREHHRRRRAEWNDFVDAFDNAVRAYSLRKNYKQTTVADNNQTVEDKEQVVLALNRIEKLLEILVENKNKNVPIATN